MSGWGHPTNPASCSADQTQQGYYQSQQQYNYPQDQTNHQQQFYTHPPNSNPYGPQAVFVSDPVGYYPPAPDPAPFAQGQGQQHQPCFHSQPHSSSQWYSVVQADPQIHPQPHYVYPNPIQYDLVTEPAYEPTPPPPPPLAPPFQPTRVHYADRYTHQSRLPPQPSTPSTLNLPQLTRRISQIYTNMSTPNKRSRPSSAASTPSTSAFAAFLPSPQPSHSPSRPPLHSPSSPGDTLTPLLRSLSLARQTTGLGLPEVKPARESASSLAAGPAGRAARLNTNKPRTTFELAVSCQLCAQRGIKLILRGSAIARADFSPAATFQCKVCLASAQPTSPRLRSPSAGPRAPGQFPSYSSTISAAIDRLSGVVHPDPPPNGSELEVHLDDGPDGNNRLKCDCCMRVVGLGKAVDQADPSSTLTPEIVCTHCQELYQLCSDCGGGGGRLTIGRWRCKELFPHSRKTCRLSHARNPRMNELQWTTHRVSEIPPELFSYIFDGCKAQYFQSRLQTTARPEALEYGVAFARTYAQTEQLAIDAWSLLSGCLTDDIEPTRAIRRYVTYQSAIPSSRRGKSKAKTQTGSEDNPIITGFLLTEWDKDNGTVHYAAAFPWAVTGDAFDATTRMGELTVATIRDDRARENAVRAGQGLAPLPELRCAWLLSPFSKDSKAFVSLRTRGYVSVDEARQGPGWVEWEQAQNRAAGGGGRGVFPPKREVHMPQPFVGTFEVAVRVFDGPDDLGGPPARRRPRKANSNDNPDAPAPPSRRK